MDIDIKLEGIEKALRTYSPRIVQKAGKSSLNKVTSAARTAASNEIRKTYNIRRKDLNKKTLKVVRAQFSNLTAIVKAEGRPISLAYFRPRQTRKGVSVRIRKGKGVTRLASHFLAEVKTKKTDITHMGVFKRLTSKRLPIAEPKMISVPSMFGGENVMPSVKKTVNDRWPRVFEHELKYFMSKER